MSDQIGGLDNGMFHHVDFFHCGTGFKQYVDPAAGQGGVNTGYVDKVMFFNSQFVSNGVGASLLASRANNLNSFVNSRFEDNADGAIVAKSNNALQLVNSDLINNGGAPSIMDVADVISCTFRADERGVSMLNSGRVEGTRFERGSSTTAKIYEQPADPFYAPNGAWYDYSFNYVVNSAADDIDVGNVEFGIFLNNDFTSRPDLSKPAVMAWLGAVTTLADGAINPRAQLLVGANYAEPGPGGGADGGSAGPGANGDDASSGSAGAASSGGAGAAGSGAGDQGGCGCIVAARSGVSPWWVVPALLLVRRRRRASPAVR